MVVRQEDL
jgi:hypothetical protein